jgi:hypothetical protein
MDMSFGIPAFYTGFGLMGIVSSLIFLVVIGMFIFIAAKGISQWNKNNHSPRLTVPATVVAKRTNVSRDHHHNNMHHTTHSTTYYVTFQVQSGDRMELHVTGQEYGLLVEGDQGSLSFQGTRYLGFERD